MNETFKSKNGLLNSKNLTELCLYQFHKKRKPLSFSVQQFTSKHYTARTEKHMLTFCHQSSRGTFFE